jgi:hypothetical protein
MKKKGLVLKKIKTMKKEAFIYTWSTEDEETESAQAFHIRMYGMDEENNNVCVHVRDFMPYFYVEVEGVTEEEMLHYESRIVYHILKLLNKEHTLDRCSDGGCPQCWKGRMTFIKGFKKLYFHQPQNSFCMIKMEFQNNIQRKRAYYKIQEKQFLLFDCLS